MQPVPEGADDVSRQHGRWGGCHVLTMCSLDAFSGLLLSRLLGLGSQQWQELVGSMSGMALCRQACGAWPGGLLCAKPAAPAAWH